MIAAALLALSMSSPAAASPAAFPAAIPGALGIPRLNVDTVATMGPALARQLAGLASMPLDASALAGSVPLDAAALAATVPLDASALAGSAPLDASALAGSVPLDVLPSAPAATPSLIVPPRYGFVLDDGRAFWFAAGASSVVALGTHVLVGLPTLLVSSSVVPAINRTSAPGFVPFLVGVGGGYMLAESALAALAATLVFNNVSKIYNGNYLVVLAAHVGGSLLGAAVSGLSFGVGALLLGGLQGLVEFTGSAGLGAITVFSVLGALPAIVIGGIALVGVPAIIGAWAMAVSASTKEGFTVNPAWKDPLPETASLSSGPRVTMPAGSIRVLALPLP